MSQTTVSEPLPDLTIRVTKSIHYYRSTDMSEPSDSKSFESLADLDDTSRVIDNSAFLFFDLASPISQTSYNEKHAYQMMRRMMTQEYAW